MADNSSEFHGTPSPKARRWISACIGLFLLWQLLLPLRYYLRTPTTDERFAWRMFSSVGMRDCKVALYETVEEEGERVRRQVPRASITRWEGMLENDRAGAVNKLLRWWCDRPGVIRVEFERVCKDIDGRSQPAERRWIDRRTMQIEIGDPP